MGQPEGVEVRDAPDEHRYEVRVDGELAGFVVYRKRPGLIAFVHTETDERFAGRGLAKVLVGEALADARRQELAVLPFCPFVNRYVQEHPEFVELVPPSHREAFGL